MLRMDDVNNKDPLKVFLFNPVEPDKSFQKLGQNESSGLDTYRNDVNMHLANDKINKLNGMFAIMILDKQTGEIFGARDRFGIKPFYYHNDGKQFTYASEIPPSLEILEQPAEANEQSRFDYFVFKLTDET